MVNANLFKRSASAANSNGQKRTYDRPHLRPGEKYGQIVGVSDYRDERFGDPALDYMKLRIHLRMIVAGGDEAQGEVEIKKFRDKGHGLPFTWDIAPKVSPPGKNPATGESTSPSNLYELFRVVLNEGEPLSDYQLGRDPETMALPFEAQGDVRAERAAEMLQQVVDLRPHVYFQLVEKVSNGQKRNKVAGINSLVPEDEKLPDFRFPEKPKDPREENDDPSIVCDRCGEQLRGYENRSTGQWVSNVEAAENSRQRYGGTFCGKDIAAIKKERAEAYARGETLPAAAAPAAAAPAKAPAPSKDAAPKASRGTSTRRRVADDEELFDDDGE